MTKLIGKTSSLFNVEGNIASPLSIQTNIIATGKTGKSLEFNWRGTELGTRVEGQAEYEYIDLKGEDANYIHDQMLSSNVWTINHDLDKYPSVSIVDTGGNLVVGDVEYISKSQLKIYFNYEFSGKAYLN